MPFVELNQARIYYRTYGQDHPGRAPLVLIHGSTVDSRTDWDSLAPKLARRYRVLAPDCRGHGRSDNPRLSYSFRELAGDTAAFVRALGYERAHLIGHSNGGNVALVTLIEHPEVIQSCVLQAANAYVTRYLIEREPKVFDAERVAREAPAWRDEMIRLHGKTNGSEYWRDLLWLTMKEILSEPNYSPTELRCVEKPTLVIMGADDPVNAPDEHAQYMARHIPGAELWIPEKTGHSVHLERGEEWLSRILDFLERRGM